MLRLSAPGVLQGQALLDELVVRARAFATTKAVRYCQQKPIPMIEGRSRPSHTLPSLVVHAKGVRRVGIQRCGNAFVCPNCSRQLRGARSLALIAMANDHASRGGRLAMVTLTVRHAADDPLAEVLSWVDRGWAAVQRRRSVRSVIKGSVGYARALEVTRGGNGWHPHLHVLFFLPPQWVHEVDGEAFRDDIADSWLKAVKKASGRASLDHVAVDYRVWKSEDAGYLSKAGYEISGVGKAEHTSSQWRMLLNGEFGAWREFSEVMAGRRSVTLSRGLSRRYSSLWRDDEAILDDGASDGWDATGLGSIRRTVRFSVALWWSVSQRPWMVSELEKASCVGGDQVRLLLSEWRRAGLITQAEFDLPVIVEEGGEVREV